MNKGIAIDRTVSILLLCLWMAVIFYMSAEPASVSTETSSEIIKQIASAVNPKYDSLSKAEQDSIIESWQHIVRKSAHFLEYVVLGVLSANAVRSLRLKKAFRYAIPPIFAALYAVSDEVHQIFVPGRSCELKDVAIDTAGGIVGCAVFFALMWLAKRVHTYKTRPQKQ